MEVDEIDAIDQYPFSLSSQNLSNSMTSAPEEEDDNALMDLTAVKAGFFLAYVLVFFFCVFGNSLILLVIIGNRSMRTVTNFFLANLAIADLLVGIFCVCQNAAHFLGSPWHAHGTWPFGRTLCHAYIYILHMIPNSSAGILVLLSVERFIAVIRPLFVSHLLTRSVLVLCTGLVWTLSATMNIPYLIAVQYIEWHDQSTDQHYGICTRRLIGSYDEDGEGSPANAFDILIRTVLDLKVVSTFNLVFWYIIPLTLLAFIYASIGLVLWRTTDEVITRSSQIGGRSSYRHTHTGSSTHSQVQPGSNTQSNPNQKLRKHSSAADTNSRYAEYRQRQRLLQEQNARKFSDSGLIATREYENGLVERAHELSEDGDRRLSNSSQRRLPKSDLVDTRKKVIRLCAVIVGVFAIFSMPRYLYLTWSVWRETNAPRCLQCISALIQPTTFLLMFFNSGLNPILYAFLSQRFRAAIKDTLNFKRRREERKEKLLMALRSHRFSEQANTERHLINGHNGHSPSGRNLYSGCANNYEPETTMMEISTTFDHSGSLRLNRPVRPN